MSLKLKSELEQIQNQIPLIKSNRNYWFIRTGSGEYYNNFIEGNYVAVSWDEVKFIDIKIAENGDSHSIKALSKRIAKIYENEKRPGYVASQLHRFTYEIKKGDIVIIPSISSSTLQFGEVLQSHAYSKDKEDGCPYEKRKKVKWVTWKSKYNIDAELYKLLFTHITISSANNYSHIIDRMLNGIFIKENIAHLVIPVNTKSKIGTTSFYDFGEIFRIANEICNEEQIGEADFDIKSKVQSQGIFEVTSTNILAVLTIGFIIISIVGGGLSLNITHNKDKTDVKSKMQSDGLIEKFRKALNSSTNRKMKKQIIEKAIKDMKITSPEELNKILDKLKDS